jgi:hypothetical protein
MSTSEIGLTKCTAFMGEVMFLGMTAVRTLSVAQAAAVQSVNPLIEARYIIY